MNIYFKTNKLIALILYLVLGIFISYVSYYQNVPNSVLILSIIIILHFILSILILEITNSKIFSLSGIFVILSYLFHFGQIILIGLFPKYKFQQFFILDYVNFYQLQQATVYQLHIITAVVTGIVLATIKKNNKIRKKTSKLNFKESRITTITAGWVILTICFPIRLMTDLSKIRASFSGNYFDTFRTGESGVIGFLGYFAFIGIALLIMGYSINKKRMSTIIFILSISYLIFTMVSGGRGQQLTIILMLLYIFFNCVYKLKIRNVIVLLVGVYLLIPFLNTIFFIREIGIDSFYSFIKEYENSLNNNPILKLLEELGATQYTVILTMERIEESAFGLSYLSALPLVFVNIGGILDPFVYMSTYQKSLKVPYIGGSYIGELFFNFRYFGIIFAIFIGIFINTISTKLKELLVEKKYLNAAIYLPMFTYFLWWVRDTFSGWIRPTIWGYVFIVIIIMILNMFIRINNSNKFPIG
ncbi:O-antigen polysaccharide polymerase Wzy [Ureibacillus terrenus]|uniref:O-antigen polysaccharide polymerase Wzy n=1 Tax=Ureibacillus terrenus TaxID=118246 RepID=UPI002E23EFAB|nr:O-antigen polysaccharide polymerase Wzy [Ureibacillus terrenus]